jgi:hypothetical protein
MSQDEVLKFFYLSYLKDDKRFFTIRDISIKLGLNYSSAYKQVRSLWFFNWLSLRYRNKKKKKYFVLNGTPTYRVNTMRLQRLKLLFKEKANPCIFSDVPLYSNLNIYNTNLELENKGLKGKCLDD